MSETDELFASVNYIKNKVDTLEKIELLNLKANKPLRDEYMALFAKDKLLLKIYKAVDGSKIQKEISEIANTTEMSVSNKLKILVENGLVEVNNVIGSKIIYKHSVAEKAFKFMRIKDE